MTTQVELVVRNFKLAYKRVEPGKPFSITEAHTTGDSVVQGDLILTIVEAVPDGYELVEDPTDLDRQLVPEGGGPGSHHRIRSLSGVELYRPKDWGKDETDLRGPCLLIYGPNAVVHEREHKPHGTVHIDRKKVILLCTYQRNLDAITRAARRAAD